MTLTSRADTWKALGRLRQLFLQPSSDGLADYWQEDSLLSCYHEFFASRIGWKWRSVLEKMQRRQEIFSQKHSSSHFPRFSHVLDWGCGTGIASLELQANGSFLLEKDAAFNLWDRSARARLFAQKNCAQQGFEALNLQETNAFYQRKTGNGLVLLSHVLTELSDAHFQTLQTQLTGAAGVLWVEPGTPFCAHRLRQVREHFLRLGYVVLAPCRHQSSCGMSAFANSPEANWCHFFASPPREIFHDADWAYFAKEVGVDLRSLPVSYLFLVHSELVAENSLGNSYSESLIVGKPHLFKGHSQVVVCREKGIENIDFQHKSDKRWAKALEKDEFEREWPLPLPSLGNLP